MSINSIAKKYASWITDATATASQNPQLNPDSEQYDRPTAEAITDNANKAIRDAINEYLAELNNEGWKWVHCEENERPAKVRYKGRGSFVDDPDLWDDEEEC